MGEKRTRVVGAEDHGVEKSARGVGIEEGREGGMGGIERVHPRPNIGCNADPIPIWDVALSNVPALALSFTHKEAAKQHPLLAETTQPDQKQRKIRKA